MSLILGAIVDLGELAVRPLGLIADEIPAQQAALRETGHRPWPLPGRPWLMGQTWRHLLFAHWPVTPELLRAHVPAELELDLRDELAWLGVTPFLLGGLRPRGGPPLPWLSRFPELNVRTYVSYGGRPGIFFFSLDAARLVTVLAARAGYHLPYFHADMSATREGGEVRYRSRRRSAGEPLELDVSYSPAGERLWLAEGSLERWLAERYCVYVVEDGRVLRGDIHHPPWPLRPARARFERNTMAAPLGLSLEAEPLLHYSERQDTLIWSLEPADA